MAEYIIKVDTQMINDIAARTESQRVCMENYMNEMKSTVTNLQDYFKGDAGTEFVTKYENVTRNIQACLDNISKEINSLKKAADVFESGNGSATNTVSGLSTDNLFTN